MSRSIPNYGPRTGRRTVVRTSGFRTTYSQSAHEKRRRAQRRQPRSVLAFTLFPMGRDARDRRSPPAYPGLPRPHVLGRPVERPSSGGEGMDAGRATAPSRGGRIKTAICDRGIPEPRRPVAERAGSPMPSGGRAGQDRAAGALGAAERGRRAVRPEPLAQGDGGDARRPGASSGAHASGPGRRPTRGGAWGRPRRESPSRCGVTRGGPAPRDRPRVTRPDSSSIFRK